MIDAHDTITAGRFLAQPFPPRDVGSSGRGLRVNTAPSALGCARKRPALRESGDPIHDARPA